MLWLFLCYVYVFHIVVCSQTVVDSSLHPASLGAVQLSWVSGLGSCRSTFEDPMSVVESWSLLILCWLLLTASQGEWDKLCELAIFLTLLFFYTEIIFIVHTFQTNNTKIQGQSCRKVKVKSNPKSMSLLLLTGMSLSVLQQQLFISQRKLLDGVQWRGVSGQTIKALQGGEDHPEWELRQQN